MPMLEVVSHPGVQTNLSKLNENSKWLVAAAFLGSICRLPQEEALWCASGAVGVSYSCKALKKVIREPRPPGSMKPLHDPGMPSNHATGIMFWSTYMALECGREGTPQAVLAAVATMVGSIGLAW
eukprot:CAMPEP_0119107960 /NCGR_PEP_ID=MMETSP1180-20130426/12634_1 /TAXON_ID=3052 ORGANISM="Chlamydomonas cf sp, Strain CCMP681" /NCGR_SAMPLE_ID=MMETSP1180 /ASSEMBLY_ACC=CAM_ASM_000741 /LENGTH=124 /DNA_ID=CAMNT_0007093513 /DNA_START=63 /DNA_END=434 /DNA_ORIENTATION=-